MSSIFVRPDVRMFLDYLNNLPGPRSHEVGPAEARIMLQKSRQVADMPPTLGITAGLDPIRDQGRAYAAACAQAGVPTIFQEARGNIHGFINLRKAIPSSEEDIRRCTDALKLLLAQQVAS